MKKILAAIAVIGILAAASACKGTVNEPTTVPDETLGDISAQDVSETASLPQESTSAETTGGAATTEADNASYIKPTELVTYSEEGIPISNAYFSLKLPASWDGFYRCTTNYEGDVMTLTFKDKSSADAGADGTLFTLALVPEGASFTAEKAEKLKTLTGDSDEYTLYVYYPQDTAYTAQTKQQYETMQKQIDGALKTLEPGAGFRF